MLHADGELYSVGNNERGQLGLGYTTDVAPNAVASWQKVSSVDAGWDSAPITAIAAGFRHTLVLAGAAALPRCLFVWPVVLVCAVGKSAWVCPGHSCRHGPNPTL